MHLDHATTEEDIDRALSFAEQGVAFDSIMVDASHADTDEENLEIVSNGSSTFALRIKLTYCERTQSKVHIARATAVGVAVEVELGRLEGGEAGLRVISDAQLTDASKAERFMKESGATLIAPSIGNLHGRYLNPPEDQFRLDLYVLRARCYSASLTSSSSLQKIHGIVKEQNHYVSHLLFHREANRIELTMSIADRAARDGRAS